MKTFSRLSLFTLVFLGLALMLVGNMADAQEPTDLTFGGKPATDAKVTFEAGTDVTVTFQLTSDTGLVDPDGNYIGEVRSGLSGGTVDGPHPFDRAGRLVVTGKLKEGTNTISVSVVGFDLTAIAEYEAAKSGISPVLIVVNSPDPKAPHQVGSTFTQTITIENRGAEFSTLPLSAWQMDVVFNPAILEVVDVTPGDFLTEGGTASTHYTEMLSSGKISASEARAGLTAPPPPASAQAPSPKGIALAPGDKEVLLTIQFNVLAFAEEALGIHNVQLQSCYTDKDGNERNDRISYSILVSDVFVATEHKTYSYAKEDVNQDEMVDILDLMVVANSLGSAAANSRADVNGDEFINVLDLVTIYKSDLWAKPAPATEKDSWMRDDNEPALTAPSVKRNVGPATIQSWIDMARIEDDGSAIFDVGITNLEALLASRIPSETRLLLNYPNPFNPETWIPYQLAESTEVTVTIHSMNGALVRTIELGHQSAGTYKSKSQAAYWDGRNEFGEQVASGLYFYTLTAGDFSATHKMLVRK